MTTFDELDLQTEVSATFHADRPPTGSELSSYLYHLRVVYSYLMENPEFPMANLQVQEATAQLEEFAELGATLTRGRQWSSADHSNYFQSDLGDSDIYILSLAQGNSFTIKIKALLIVPLIAALILSGDQISYDPPGGGRFELDLPPIGEGIGALRDSLGGESPIILRED